MLIDQGTSRYFAPTVDEDHPDQRRVCRACKQPGHIAKDCTKVIVSRFFVIQHGLTVSVLLAEQKTNTSPETVRSLSFALAVVDVGTGRWNVLIRGIAMRTVRVAIVVEVESTWLWSV